MISILKPVPAQKSPNKNMIIFFDDVCVLCNKTVTFLQFLDRRNKFYYAPLQGKTASLKLSPLMPHEIENIIVYDQGKKYIKSDAVIIILLNLGGLFKLAIVLKLVPKFIRDYFYSLIAKNRYDIFGKNPHCRIPSPSEKDSFLD